MCPRCEGMGSVTDFDLTQLYDDAKSLNEGALSVPGYSMDGWYGRIFRGCGFFDPDKPISKFTKKELNDRSEEHTSELQSLMRISYAVFFLEKKKTNQTDNTR